MRPSPGSDRVCGGSAPGQSPDGGDVELPNGHFAQIDHADLVGGSVSDGAVHAAHAVALSSLIAWRMDDISDSHPAGVSHRNPADRATRGSGTSCRPLRGLK